MKEVVVRADPNAFQSALSGELGPLYLTDTDVRAFDPLLHLSEFEKLFPKELALFHSVGIHPNSQTAITNPYTGQLTTENYANIGEHCLAVGYCAFKIANALFKARLIEETDRDWVTSRALVHDLTKPYELMRRDSQRTGASEDVYSVPAYEKLRPLLIANGVSSDIAEYLIEAGRETGHNSLKDFIVCGPDGFEGLVQGNLAAKVVHLADDMTFTSIPKGNTKALTAFLTCWERLLASQFLEKYPFLWSEGLGQSDDGKVVAIRDLTKIDPGLRLVGSYAELQVRVANAIAREIQLLLQPESQLRPENFVRNLVNAA